MPLQGLDPFLFTKDDARLRAAQQLVPRKAEDVHPGPDAVHDGGLAVDADTLQIEEAARAQILDDRQTGLAAQLHHFGEGHAVGKAQNAVIAGMHLEQGPGVFPDSPLIVPQVGLVGGTHFPQQAAALLHDLGDAEGAADLHQLPPGGNDLSPFAHGAEDQQNGGGVVVDYHGTFCPGDLAQELFHMTVTGAPLTVLQIIFQGGIPPGHRGRSGHRLFGQAGPAQIGMQGHAGGVDHRPQGGLGGCFGCAADVLAQFLHGGQALHVTFQHPAAQGVDAFPHQIGHHRLRQFQRRHRLLPQQVIHTGQPAKQLLFSHRQIPPKPCFF